MGKTSVTDRRYIVAAVILCLGWMLWLGNRSNVNDLTPADGGSYLQDFYAEDYGATGDGETDDSAAIYRAMAAVEAAGGGVLHFGKGQYLSQPSPTIGPLSGGNGMY